MMGKVDVNGGERAPALEVADGAKRRACSAAKSIKWNFTKFLVGRTARCSSATRRPTRPNRCESDIEAALAA